MSLDSRLPFVTKYHSSDAARIGFFITKSTKSAKIPHHTPTIAFDSAISDEISP